MRNVPNSLITTLVRCLPVLVANIDMGAMKRSTRLYNAVRLVKLLLPKIEKIDKQNEETEHNH